MLAEAKILITSAPAAATSSTCARISAGPPVPSITGRTEVSTRGPGREPLAMALRSGMSSEPPTLCTVVTPLRSMFHAFSAAYSICSRGPSVETLLCSRSVSRSKCQPRCTWVSISPGSRVAPDRSYTVAASVDPAAVTASIRPPRMTTSLPVTDPPRPSRTRSARSTTADSGATPPPTGSPETAPGPDSPPQARHSAAKATTLAAIRAPPAAIRPAPAAIRPPTAAIRLARVARLFVISMTSLPEVNDP